MVISWRDLGDGIHCGSNEEACVWFQKNSLKKDFNLNCVKMKLT